MRSLLLPEKGERCERSWPKLEERRQTHLPPGVWIAARWSGVVVRQAFGVYPGALCGGGLRGESRKARESSGSWVLVNGVGLQTLVRGAFPVLPR